MELRSDLDVRCCKLCEGVWLEAEQVLSFGEAVSPRAINDVIEGERLRVLMASAAAATEVDLGRQLAQARADRAQRLPALQAASRALLADGELDAIVRLLLERIESLQDQLDVERHERERLAHAVYDRLDDYHD